MSEYPVRHPVKEYYNRFDPEKNYEKILVRAGYRWQSAEPNDMQEAFLYRLKSIADALFRDGDVVQGGQIVVDQRTGETQAEAGVIYIHGGMRRIPAAAFTIPVSGQVGVGVYIRETIVSELEDPSLRNPAIGTRGEGDAGAWRLRVDAQWGFDGDGGAGAFYPVYFVEDGVARSKEAPPNLDAFTQGLARYDRDSTAGGTYIVGGLVVRSAGTADEYTVSEGRARVRGYGIDLPTSRRLSYPASPDLRHVDTEVHTADGSASRRIDVAHPPIHDITLLRATLRKTVSVVHGAYSGAGDMLPDPSVVDILECRQGDTVYVRGADYKRDGDKADWSPPGNEPAPGSTYSVTYTYMTAVAPIDQDYDGFSVEGAVAGSSIILSYNQAVRRIDRLCLTQDGAFVWQRGVAAEYNPRKPVAPEGTLALASVTQSWRGSHSPGDVENDGVRVTSFDEQELMRTQISDLYAEVARQRLEADISTREAGARVGIFVDPLLSDEMRDQGIPQSAAVVEGWLTLPITATVHALDTPSLLPAVPAHTPTVILSQLLRTGEMKVNPYMAFDVLPARVELNPAIDQWTEARTEWTSPVTRVFNTGHYVPGRSWITWQTTRKTTETAATVTTDIEHLREINVDFRARGFGAGELLRNVFFDGVEAEFTAGEADGDGVLTGSFVIPPDIPAGAKEVVLQGSESEGAAVFVGQGELTVRTLREVRTVRRGWADPLAQTFVLDVAARICGVDLWFTAKGGETRAQIREVRNGVPGGVILAESVLGPEHIVVTGGGHTRALFPVPVHLQAGIEYALVILCNDPATAVSVAEMGKFDATVQRWVASQPYTVGVLLSSSNASTWTPHQDKDLTFRLLEAVFSPDGLVTFVDMGDAELSGATDLMVLAVDETPSSETRVEYEIVLPTGDTLIMARGQSARLNAPLSGKASVRAKLSGTDRAMPLLWPGAQLLSGSVEQAADYYSRSIPAFGANRAVLIFDALIPSGATVTPEIQVDGGVWQSLTRVEAVPQGDGVVELSFSAPLQNADLVKARFTLTGTSAARPFVGLIRFMAIK